MQRKLFLPTYGMFDEARYFTRGADFTFYSGALGKTAILICEDAWHLELAYAASVARADAVVVISSSPARGYSVNPGFNSTRFWRNRLQTCVLSYGQNYVYSNRGGVEDGIMYDGSNFVIDSGANFLPHQETPAYAGAGFYTLPATGVRHAGLSGDSSRQNDPALVKSILEKLST
jgi:predicted amidohydrolase